MFHGPRRLGRPGPTLAFRVDADRPRRSLRGQPCLTQRARQPVVDDGGALDLLVVSLAHCGRAGMRHGVEECFELFEVSRPG